MAAPIHTKPDYKPSYNTHFVSEFEASVQVADKDLIKQAETDFRAMVNLGTAKFTMGDAEGALDLFLRALEEEPHNVVALCNASIAYGEMTRFDLALHYARKASETDPRDRYAASVYAENLLRSGQWRMGWDLYERCRFGKVPCPIPHWNGEDLEGKRLLVVHEGGNGDMFMNFRFFRELHALGAEVSFAVDQELHCVIEDHPWVGKLIVSEGARIKVSDFDYHVSSFSLPGIFVPDIEHVPQHGAYLSGPHPVRHLGSKPRVGLCWAAGEKMDTKRHRSLTMENIKTLVSNTSVDWVSLQYGREDIAIRFGMLTPTLKTWEHTAEALDALDLVITVDTGVMHLAGAIGRPVWTMLSNSCWRFLVGREDCLWYPQMRLFRNHNVGFNGVVAEVNKALHGVKWSDD